MSTSSALICKEKELYDNNGKLPGHLSWNISDPMNVEWRIMKKYRYILNES